MQSANDGIECTFDRCLTVFGETTSFCKNTPRHFLCDDGAPCTADVCDPDAGCAHPRSCAGSVPGGEDLSSPVIASKSLGEQTYTLTWSGSTCSPEALDYAIYEGPIGLFQSHTPGVVHHRGADRGDAPAIPGECLPAGRSPQRSERGRLRQRGRGHASRTGAGSLLPPGCRLRLRLSRKRPSRGSGPRNRRIKGSGSRDGPGL